VKRSWVVRAAGVVLAVAATLSGCDGGNSPTDEGDNFTITISLSSSALSVEQDADGTVAVSLARGGGYTGTVSLSVEGTPSGVTATADPSSLAAGSTSSTITVSAAATADPGSYALTVRATGSEVSAATATLNLTVTEKPGFSLALSPTTLSIQQGEEGTSTAAVTRVGGFSGAVALAISGAPTGMTVTADPASVTGTSSTLTVSVDGSVTPGEYPLTVTGTASGLPDQTAALTVTVTEAPPPSFSLSLSPSSLSIAQGGDGTSTLEITRGGGFTGEVSLTVTGMPAGVTATLDPTATTGSTSAFAVSVGESVVAGSYTLTVTGTADGFEDQTTELELTVTAVVSGSFTLAMNPETLSIQQGASESSTVEITRSGGFEGDVALAVSGMPEGMTAEFSPAGAPAENGDKPQPITGNSAVLTITVGAAVTPDDFALTVTGTAEGLDEQTTALTVTVTPAPAPSFSLGLTPSSLSITQGGNGTSSLAITRGGGFAGEVSLAVTGMPAGVTAVADPAATTGSTSTLTVTVAGGVAAGSYTLTVTGTATGLADQTTDLSLTVTQSGAGQQVTWTFCDETGAPLWVAIQDGTGPWTQVVGANNTYTFSLSSEKAGVAFVTDNGSGAYSTFLYYASTSELVSFGGSQCTTPGEITKTVHGSVSGLGLTDQATVTLGGAYANVQGAGASTFTLEGVSQGPQDLIATRVIFSLDGGVVTQSVDKFLFRRSLEPADGSTLAVLDFGGAEAFDPVSRDLTIENLGTDQAGVSLSYFTAHGASAAVFTGFGGSGSQTFPAVPGSQQESGDLHILAVTAIPGDAQPDHTRSATSLFKDAADQTLTLGPVLGPVTVSSAATSPYLRPRAQYTVQSEYDGMWFLGFSQDSGNSATFLVTAGYQAGSTDFDRAFPDFSGTGGWQNIWGMSAGISTDWVMSANGWTTPGGIFGFPYVEGGLAFSATRMGSITP